MALVWAGSGGIGVESISTPDMASNASEVVARLTGGTVTVSGSRDLIFDGVHQTRVDRGTPMLTRVTGTGCLHAALTAACATATQDSFKAAHAATTWLNVAGEIAAQRAAG